MTTNPNRSSRTLIAEGFAIVASILLAFAIDAWWDERQLRQEESEVLQTMQVEFEANLAQVTSIIASHEESVVIIDELLTMSDAEILGLPQHRVARFVYNFARPRTFDAVRGSLDAVLGSGRLGILRDRRLREALATFDNIIDDAAEDRMYLAETALKVWFEMARYGGPFHRPELERDDDAQATGSSRSAYISQSLQYLPWARPEDLLNMRKDQALMGYVNQNKINAVHYTAELVEIREQVEIILDLIGQSRSD